MASNSDVPHGHGYGVLDCLHALRIVDQRCDEPLTKARYSNTVPDCLPSLSAISNRVGSWSTAKAQAGLEADLRGKTGPTFSDEELLDALETCASRVEGPLSIQEHDAVRDEDMPAARTIKDRFEGWNVAKEQAGLATTPSRPSGGQLYSTDDVLDALVSVAEANDTIRLTRVQYDEYSSTDQPSRSTIVSRINEEFDTERPWNLAHWKAGLCPYNRTLFQDIFRQSPTTSGELETDSADRPFRAIKFNNHDVFDIFSVLSVSTHRFPVHCDVPSVFYVPTEDPFRDVVEYLLDVTNHFGGASEQTVVECFAEQLSGVRADVAQSTVREYQYHNPQSDPDSEPDSEPDPDSEREHTVELQFLAFCLRQVRERVLETESYQFPDTDNRLVRRRTYDTLRDAHFASSETIVEAFGSWRSVCKHTLQGSKQSIQLCA